MTVLLAVEVKKFVPVMVSGVAVGATVGLIELTFGADGVDRTVKDELLVAVPFAFCTLIVPVVAPTGTVVTI